MSENPLFHLAVPVTDLEATRRFFTDVLGCRVGREDERWIDFDFFGHQLSAHLTEEMPRIMTNLVDGKQIPVSHFGLVLEWRQWHAVVERLREKSVTFLVDPCLRFEGQAGEQATLFVQDPSGNAIELKSFREPARLFARQD
jgi:extradiol dioxygenase family protein